MSSTRRTETIRLEGTYSAGSFLDISGLLRAHSFILKVQDLEGTWSSGALTEKEVRRYYSTRKGNIFQL